MQRAISWTFPLAALMVAVLSTQAQDQKSGDAPEKNMANVWAGLSVSQPVFAVGGTGSLQLNFALINEGTATINPEVGKSNLVVNGNVPLLWSGPCDDRWNALPPGGAVQCGKALGEYFASPGTYEVAWKGAHFASKPIVFRVLANNGKTLNDLRPLRAEPDREARTPEGAQAPGERRALSIGVKAAADSATFKSGEVVAITVSVTNDLPHPIRFSHFSLEPNEWNGETASCKLVDIYRDDESMVIFQAAPKVEVPIQISGESAPVIDSHGSIKIHLDLRKWTVKDGWKPGRYRATVRVEGLHLDSFTTAHVLSEKFEFAIK